jgi:hypothetical protein
VTVPDPVFRAALNAGDLQRVIALAKQMPPMRLDDALRVCLLMRDGDHAVYERAAVRWLGRFALEGRNIAVEDIQSAASALDVLPEYPDTAMAHLQQLCLRKGLG